MKVSGNLAKLQARLDTPVQYSLPVGKQRIAVNELLGQPLRIESSGAIHCVACGRKTSKSFNQGYCYPCFQSLAQCDSCIVRPELCHYFAGTCREPDWAAQHCLRDHYVYLATSSGLKVGITRGTQIPTRWIDQGASQALPILKVSNRRVAGLVEVAFKQHVADKTAWQRMLKGAPQAVDLASSRDELFEKCAGQLTTIGAELGDAAIHVLDDEHPVQINYPVTVYPDKVKALNLDKTPLISGVLQGIKGQYLILDSGVLNIRKYSGYQIEFSV